MGCCLPRMPVIHFQPQQQQSQRAPLVQNEHTTSDAETGDAAADHEHQRQQQQQQQPFPFNFAQSHGGGMRAGIHGIVAQAMQAAAINEANKRPFITADGTIIVPFNQFAGTFCVFYPQEMKNFMDEKEYGEVITTLNNVTVPVFEKIHQTRNGMQQQNPFQMLGNIGNMINQGMAVAAEKEHALKSIEQYLFRRNQEEFVARGMTFRLDILVKYGPPPPRSTQPTRSEEIRLAVQLAVPGSAQAQMAAMMAQAKTESCACGGKVTAVDAFCPSCGKSLRVTCGGCGTVCASGQNFCNRCGQSLSASQQSPSAAAPPPAYASSDPNANAVQFAGNGNSSASASSVVSQQQQQQPPMFAPGGPTGLQPLGFAQPALGPSAPML